MNYVIIGATSAIALATARRWATADASFHLVARDSEALARISQDLLARGARSVTCSVLDLADLAACDAFMQRLDAEMPKIDVTLIAHGVLPDQAACEQSVAAAIAALNVNGLSHVVLATAIAQRLEQQGSGSLAVITSVAGDRGRQSNYVYGAAKAMASTFLSGLRNRLHAKGVQVLDIRPGFVDTPMTADFTKGPLWADADQVAAGIVRSVERRKSIVYLPFFWRYIMLVIRLIPEPLFKRLSL